MLLVLQLLLMIFLRLGVAFAEAALRISGGDILHLLGCYRCGEVTAFKRPGSIVFQPDLVESIFALNEQIMTRRRSLFLPATS
jgi:hypothetical protein